MDQVSILLCNQQCQSSKRR